MTTNKLELRPGMQKAAQIALAIQETFESCFRPSDRRTERYLHMSLAARDIYRAILTEAESDGITEPKKISDEEVLRRMEEILREQMDRPTLRSNDEEIFKEIYRGRR